MSEVSLEHTDEARAALNAIVTDPEHGVAALSSAQTMSNLLKDLLPDAPREKSILVAAAEAGVATRLREHVQQGMDPGTAIRLTASSLESSTPFTPEACSWVAGEIANAMGISAPVADSGSVPQANGYDAVGGMPTQTSDPGAGAPGQGQGFGFPATPVQSAPGAFGSPAQGGFGAPDQGGFGTTGIAAAGIVGLGAAGGTGPGGFQAPGTPFQPTSGPGFQAPGQGFAPPPQGVMPGQPGGFGAPQGFPPAPGWQPGQSYQPAVPNNRLAITALISGCAQIALWFLFLVPGFLAAIVALVCGLAALKQLRGRNEAGRGMAIAGVILGGIGILGGLFWILVFAVSAAHSGNNGY
jgi:hypothetical protein